VTASWVSSWKETTSPSTSPCPRGASSLNADSVTGRTRGAAELPVTPLGICLAALGRPGYINLGHAEDLDASYEVATMQARADRTPQEASRARRTRSGS